MRQRAGRDAPRVLILGLAVLAVACGGNAEPQTPDASGPPTVGAMNDAGFVDAAATANDAGFVDAAETSYDDGFVGPPMPSPDAGGCSATTCRGCCQQGVCYPGIDSMVCGSGGQACQSCGPGAACIGQQCAILCGAGNCNGCCTGNQCLPGNTQTACGQQGGQCADCTALGSTCLSDAGTGGACKPASTCDATICPTGCCDANGICKPGNVSSACGAGGGACEACPSGQVCAADQQCTELCNRDTCPTGCCTSTSITSPGTCQPGTAADACGTLGSLCHDCSESGRQCRTGIAVPVPGDSLDLACAPIATGCDCPYGCCDQNGQCQLGTLDALCGTGDSACQDCTLSGTQCAGQSCSAPLDAGVCNGNTCTMGCCDNAGVCQQGLTNLVCGAGGVSCANCLSMYMVCSNQQCATPPEGTPCGPSTCQGCCDDTGMCGYGDEDTACGKGGNRCADCTTPRGGSCSGGYCLGPGGTMPCSETCQGCCDAQGNCQAGFANSQCGGLGATCEDCTALSPASTCDTAGSSPICAGQEAQCSAAYAGCPAALEELAPVVQNVCSTDDLQNAAVACSAGATSDTCSAFFQAESTIHSPCGNCLQPFDFDFATQSGIFACVAPYVSATCNHSTACLVDCITQSCYGCPDSAACAAQAPSTSCSAYAQAGPCVTQALGGPAALCDPSTYQGNFGAWLAAVGAKYCGP